ncbi:MAG: tetratricopeptide repeat protein [Sandaracinaceae bacterium]
MKRVLSILVLTLLVGCGGATPDAETPAELPPVNPAAAREFNTGARLLARGGRARTRRAVTHFETALELDPNVWEAHYNLGVIARAAGELREAVTHFESAREIQPAAGEVLVGLAEARYTLGETDQAAGLLNDYVNGHPDSIPVRIALTAVERQRGRHDEALGHAREVLIRQPRNAAALAEIGRIYRAREQYDVAQLVFQKAIEIQDSASLHNDMGLLELARGDTQAAFEQFAAAIALDAGFAAAHLNQGSVLLHAGDFAGARAEYEAVLEEDADNLDARVALAAALRGQDEHARARRELEAVLEENENHPAALFNLGVLMAEFLDERPGARTLFERFLRVAPSTGEHRVMAEQYLQDIPAPGAPQPEPL